MIIGYLEDGADLVGLATSGWEEGHPAWWLNLEAHPDAVVRPAGRGLRPVRAREAVGEERERLWHRWAAVDHGLDGYAARRSSSPRSSSSSRASDAARRAPETPRGAHLSPVGPRT